MSADGTIAWAALPACFAVAAGGTWLARRYALARALLDHPGERRSHRVATPRGGGIGIVAALLCACAALALWTPALAPFLASVALGLALVAAIGWWDDHRPLSPLLRLGVHALAAGALGWAVHARTGEALDACVAAAIALALINIWNFMDGIDGIAGLQALVVAVACCLIAEDPATRWLCLALAAAVAGFLPFNVPRARIFLGDVGSGALGYAVAVLMVLVATGGAAAGGPASLQRWLLVLLPPSAFLVDASLTLATRMLRGERWWTAHVDHAYQHWARRRGHHLRVALAYAGWSLIAGALAYGMRRSDFAIIMSSAIAWFLSGGIAWTRLRTRRRDAGLSRSSGTT